MNNAPNPDFLNEEIESESNDATLLCYSLKDAIDLGDYEIIESIQKQLNNKIKRILSLVK